MKSTRVGPPHSCDFSAGRGRGMGVEGKGIGAIKLWLLKSEG